jgi:flagellar hook assembly protein FlgD
VAAVPKPGVAGTAESFTVTGLVANQAYFFAIRTADDAGNWSPMSNVVRKLAVGPVGVSSEGVPTTDVSKPWPNPARSIANLAVSLAAPGDVAVDVFDLMGRHVRTLAKGPWPMGDHSTTWDLRDDRGNLVPSAMYKVRARLGAQEFVRSVVVVR